MAFTKNINIHTNIYKFIHMLANHIRFLSMNKKIQKIIKYYKNVLLIN